LMEALLARKIESRYSKNDILSAYLNSTYYGSGCYGIEAAARTYFGKPAKRLSLAQAALLAGLPQRPAAFNPWLHPAAALTRRAEALNRLLANGYINRSQLLEAQNEPLRLRNHLAPGITAIRAPYFVAHVVSLLQRTYGQEILYSGSTIVTTLNWQMQRAADKAMSEAFHNKSGPNTGALIAIDPHSGDVRALVGGASFTKDQFDAAIDGVRQPGSAFKPIVYAAAFDSGACNLLSIRSDRRQPYRVGEKTWTVRDYDGAYRGNTTILDAIRLSINTIAVQVCTQIDPTRVVQYARSLGITTPMDPVLPLALGAFGVHPIDLCDAYSAFANEGARYLPVFIKTITDPQGHTSYSDAPQQRLIPPVLDSQAIDQINVALADVVSNGTGQAASSIPDACGKTGTSSDMRDAWFVGYTPQLCAAVWLARSCHRPPRGKSPAHWTYLPMPGETGGRACAPVWRRFMATAAPIQAETDSRLGIVPPPIPSRPSDAVLAELAHENSLAAQQRVAAGTSPELAAPPGFDEATYGSPPITCDADVGSPSGGRTQASGESVTQSAAEAAAPYPAGRPLMHRRLKLPPGDGSNSQSQSQPGTGSSPDSSPPPFTIAVPGSG
ncbi:MAG TPA: transglycosylase domain-containing protein, partial [Chthonomonadales bacterium]|nr:transglycosylase domain-containing protein [Chthonomonadales bacterium]